MQAKHKIVLENLFSLGAMQFIGYIFPLITVPYITRTVGVEKYGLIAFANSFIQYLIVISEYGCGDSGIYRIANNRHNKNNISNIFNSVMATKIIMFCIAFIIMLVLTFSIPKFREIWPLIFASYLSVLGNVLMVNWFFIGMEKMKYLTILNVVSGTLFTSLIFLFVKNPQNYVLIPLFTSLGTIVAGFFSIYIAAKKEGLEFYIPKWKSIIYQFKFSTQFFISKITSFGAGVTNTFCLGFVSSMVLVGYYTAAYTIHLACSSILAAISQAIYPYMIKNKDKNFYKKYSLTAISVCSFLFVILYIIAKSLVTIYFGANMVEAYKVLQLFCIHLLLQIWSVLIAEPLLGAYGQIKEVNTTNIATAIIHYIGLALLIVFGKFTIYSIVYLMIATCIISIIMKIYYLIKFNIIRKIM